LRRVEEYLKKISSPGFRYKQFKKAFYQEAVSGFDEVTPFPLSLREKLKKNIEFSSLEEVKKLVSDKGNTIKVLFRVKSLDKNIESVLMRHEDGRNTVCVSCMVGCPVGCTFCATGKLGFKGNLNSEQIVDQVMYFARILKKEKQKITNVVYMGMGEPMLNLSSVEESIKILNDPDGFNLGQRKITVSTSGIIAPLKKFIDKGFRVRLAISLHAPSQELRESIMPIAKANPIKPLFDLLTQYENLTNKRITYEYIMINGVNDGSSHAERLGKLLRGRLAHVNLIPYNPVKGVKYDKSTRENIQNFKAILDKYGVYNTIRVSMGEDVSAACGQLAGEINF